jgi:hypothetical protein
MSFSDSEPRRYLIAVGSPTCEYMKLPKLENVERDLEQVANLFKVQGYERVLSEQILLGAMASEITTNLSSWFASSERRTSDCVVIYYAGHGDEGGKFGKHYLFTLESREDSLSQKAIATHSLIESFFPNTQHSPQNVLLILDVCYANTGVRQTAESLNRLRGVNAAGSGFWMIASSRSNDEAGDGDFVAALSNVMQAEYEGFLNQGEFISIGALVEAINQHLKTQKAVSNSAEVQAEARFIVNPRYTDLGKLPAADRLVPILKQIEREQWTDAYKTCYAEWIHGVVPTTAKSLLSRLVNLPDGIDQLLPKFVELLIQNESISSELRESIQTWANHNLTRIELEQTQNSAKYCCLMVGVNEHKQQRGYYTIEACFAEDRDPQHRNDQWQKTKLSIPIDEDAAVSAEQIFPMIAAIVTDVVDDKEIQLSDLAIECFLPKKLLHLPIEQVEIDIFGEQHRTGCECKAVMVRSSERRKRSPAHGNWKSRWDNFQATALARDAVVCKRGDQRQFDEALEDYTKIGCAFDSDDVEHQGTFQKILVKGIAISIWLRPNHSISEPRSTLESVLNRCVGDLPTALTGRRFQYSEMYSQISPHLALLWDNPYRPFPDDNWTGRSA